MIRLAAVGGRHVLALPELAGARFLDTWRPDPAAIVAVVLLGGAYLWGVVRLRRHGERWPFRRTVVQGRDWGPSVQRDQMIGGRTMISIAELVGLLFLIAMLAEWARREGHHGGAGPSAGRRVRARPRPGGRRHGQGRGRRLRSGPSTTMVGG
ncbi:hypothetical protein ACFY3M_25880 [Streptomyces mirabilis]|uniref:hypothetical protein n=1 Tax=Streptomyces mirabilis TaxID=68239 RepID=UPI0036782E5B